MPKRTAKLKLPKVWLSDTWALELLGLVLSIIALIAITILLQVYDGHPQFSFHGITLNAVVAVLAACVRIGFAIPVNEGLAQWKWLWFSRKARALGDFDALDDASRGSRGSLLLLWETRSSTIPAVAAWVILLSVATEPFIQQIVSIEDKVIWHNATRVQLPYAQSWSGATENGGSPEASFRNPTGNHLEADVSEYGSVSNIQLDSAGQAAIQFGLDAASKNVMQQVPTFCPTGNCTWPHFASLAVCSACYNISSEIRSANKVDLPMSWFYPIGNFKEQDYGPENLTSYYLPNGLNLDNRFGQGDPYSYQQYTSSWPMLLTALANASPSKSIKFKNATTLLFSTTILRVPAQDFPTRGRWQSDNESKELSAFRDPESFSVLIADTENATLKYYDGVAPHADALFDNATYFRRTRLAIDVPETHATNYFREANISQQGIDGLMSYIKSIFDDGNFTDATIDGAVNCTLDSQAIRCGRLRNVTGMATGNTDADATTATQFLPAVMEELWTSQNTTAFFAKVATSMTNEIRRNAEGQPFVTGQLGTMRTVLNVRWAWITLPVVLVVVSGVFLLVTILESRRAATPLWKGSVLATLYHGLETRVRETVDHWDQPSEMEEATKVIRVRLGREGGIALLRTQLEAPEKTQSTPLPNKPSDQRQLMPLPNVLPESSKPIAPTSRDEGNQGHDED